MIEEIAERHRLIACAILESFAEVCETLDAADLIFGLHTAAAIVTLKTEKSLNDAQRDRIRDRGALALMAALAADASAKEMKRKIQQDIEKN